MKIVTQIRKEQPPKGKRTVRENKYGNTNGYIGGRFWICLGPTYDSTTKDSVKEFLSNDH